MRWVFAKIPRYLVSIKPTPSFGGEQPVVSVYSSPGSRSLLPPPERGIPRATTWGWWSEYETRGYVLRIILNVQTISGVLNNSPRACTRRCLVTRLVQGSSGDQLEWIHEPLPCPRSKKAYFQCTIKLGSCTSWAGSLRNHAVLNELVKKITWMTDT